ncbi:hypothetical protein DSLASN_35650 [Desulfoluna limicola]|uniref:Uncharacterized protein n=1 Tax=Desulfoluna limicola TaxID=2810562 RepID=A0ABM7PK43_9BACT|nr:hypothetical protein DSLASN_35650 [Desulfoluna limicola]
MDHAIAESKSKSGARTHQALFIRGNQAVMLLATPGVVPVNAGVLRQSGGLSGGGGWRGWRRP